MDEDWKVGKGPGACARCGEALDRTTAHFSALLAEPVTREKPSGYRREDYCAECWAALAGTLREKGVLETPPPVAAPKRRRRRRRPEPSPEGPPAGAPSSEEAAPPSAEPGASESAAAAAAAAAEPPPPPALSPEIIESLAAKLLSYWRVMPVPPAETEKHASFLDEEAVLEAFRRLEATPERDERVFRYVLALHLRRKRLLRLVETLARGGPEGERVLVFRERGNESDLFRVLEPEMTESDAAAVTSALDRVLDPDWREKREREEAARKAAAARAPGAPDSPETTPAAGPAGVPASAPERPPDGSLPTEG